MIVVPFCSLVLAVMASHFVLGPIGWKIGSAVSAVVFAGITGSFRVIFAAVFGLVYAPVDYKNGDKWNLMEPDKMQLKRLFEIWQTGMQQQNGWNALFWCNHDQPRIVSRLGDEGKYWKQSAKMLAACIHLMRGTPYIYQGEELGMTNPHYHNMEQYQDIESLNYYDILLKRGKSEQEALAVLDARSRDNARTPMQWSDCANAGFTQRMPWIELSQNYHRINAKVQMEDGDSVFAFYKKLIALRKAEKVVSKGSIEFLEKDNPDVLAYRRNLSKKQASCEL